MTDDLHSPEELRAHMGRTAMQTMDAIDDELGEDLTQFSDALITFDMKLRERNLPQSTRAMWIIGIVLGATLEDGPT